LPNVSVTATASETGIDHATVTSSAGEFLFQDLPIGEYVVQTSSNGFQGVKIDKVPVSSGAVYTLKVTLHPAQTMTSVEVSADQVGLDTASSTELTVLPTKAIQDLPQIGRDVSELLAQSQVLPALRAWAAVVLVRSMGPGAMPSIGKSKARMIMICFGAIPLRISAAPLALRRR
jgi:hypothetical protein